mgnify:CR=1 FL=1
MPVLGICYGMQTMAMQLGGLTETSDHREFGYASVLMDNPTALFAHLNDGDNKLDVWMSHGDKVTRLPENFQVTGTTPTCPIAAMSDENRRFYGVQFHPEVTHTKKRFGIIDEFRGEHFVVAKPNGQQKALSKMPLLALKRKWAMMK